jgi:hypothetical protein
VRLSAKEARPLRPRFFVSVQGAEAEFPPGFAIYDGELAEDVLDSEAALLQFGVVGEEGAGVGVSQKEAQGTALGDEVDADLRGAVFPRFAGAAESFRVSSHRPDPIEGAADGLAILVEAACAAVSQDPGFDGLARTLAALELEPTRQDAEITGQGSDAGYP